MKKLAFVLIVVIVISVFVACTGDIKIADGTYRAEYSDYDEYGYKDFVEVTFKNGEVTEVVADGTSGKDGSLKSESEEFRDKMEGQAGTYPEKYYMDLINQYMANPSADEIEIVAGATETSKSFIVLLKALEKSIRVGNTETVIVERK